MHRKIVAALQVLIASAMLVLFFGVDSFGNANPVVLMLYLIAPAMVIIWSLVDIERRARIIGYYGLAVCMVPLAALGVFGGYGILYLFGVLTILWAAWVENEGN